MEQNIIVIHPDDNVAVAAVEIRAGQEAAATGGLKLTARTDVPKNHKIAIAKIPARADVIKYGEAIGVAGEDIEPGDWVHTHNMKSKGE